MISNIISFLQNLANRLRPAGSQPPASGQTTPPGGGGQGPSAQGPQQQETHTYHIRPIVNGKVTTRIEEVTKQGGALSVDITETRVLTANGTLVNAKDIVLICGICGLPSEENWYCDICSMPLCVPDVLCVEIPDTGEIHHLCPFCCRRLYAEWDTWRGQLKPPFSVRKETRQRGEKS